MLNLKGSYFGVILCAHKSSRVKNLVDTCLHKPGALTSKKYYPCPFAGHVDVFEVEHHLILPGLLHSHRLHQAPRSNGPFLREGQPVFELPSTFFLLPFRLVLQFLLDLHLDLKEPLECLSSAGDGELLVHSVRVRCPSCVACSVHESVIWSLLIRYKTLQTRLSNIMAKRFVDIIYGSETPEGLEYLLFLLFTFILLHCFYFRQHVNRC